MIPAIITINPEGAEAGNAVEAEIAMALVEEEIVVGTNPRKITTENENEMEMTLMDQTFHILTILRKSMQP